MNWNRYGDVKPSNDDEVVINTSASHSRFNVRVKCNCQYDSSTNSWIILDPLYVKCGDGNGLLKCKDEDMWCTKDEYREFQKEQNKLKREAAKKKKVKKD